MSKIKRLLTIFLMFFLVSFLFSCEIVFNNTNQPSGNTPSGDDTEDYENLRPSGGSTNLYIYAVNDFHGIVYKEGESVGLSRLFGYLRTQKEKNPNNTVILSSGDMFQGSGLSSMSRGKIVLDAMNYVGFDAMAIGNHEFDWGLEEVTKYVDGSLENGEATFPILGANVLKVSDGKIADLLQPYVVIKRAGLLLASPFATSSSFEYETPRLNVPESLMLHAHHPSGTSRFSCSFQTILPPEDL